jgi:hypothetical protein
MEMSEPSATGLLSNRKLWIYVHVRDMLLSPRYIRPGSALNGSFHDLPIWNVFR